MLVNIGASWVRTGSDNPSVAEKHVKPQKHSHSNWRVLLRNMRNTRNTRTPRNMVTIPGNWRVLLRNTRTKTNIVTVTGECCSEKQQAWEASHSNWMRLITHFSASPWTKQYKDTGCGHKCYLYRKGRYTKVLCGWTRMLSFWDISNRACVVCMWRGEGRKHLQRQSTM